MKKGTWDALAFRLSSAPPPASDGRQPLSHRPSTAALLPDDGDDATRSLSQRRPSENGSDNNNLAAATAASTTAAPFIVLGLLSLALCCAGLYFGWEVVNFQQRIEDIAEEKKKMGRIWSQKFPQITTELQSRDADINLERAAAPALWEPTSTNSTGKDVARNLGAASKMASSEEGGKREPPNVGTRRPLTAEAKKKMKKMLLFRLGADTVINMGRIFFQ